ALPRWRPTSRATARSRSSSPRARPADKVPRMGLLADFKTFALKGNVVDLAVAVVIGGAFGKIVSALVADVVMPVVGAILPSGEWRAWQVSPLHLKVGDFLGAILDFLIIAMVLFLVVTR